MAGKLDTLKRILGSVAPTLASFVPGGPLAALAISTVSKVVLGKPDGKPEEIDAALATNTDPELLLKLKQADQDFQEKMSGIGVDLERLRVENVESARAMQIAHPDWMTPVLAYGMVGFFFAFAFVALFEIGKLPTASLEIASVILGVVVREVGAIYGFKFGDTSASQNKTTVVVDALKSASK